MSEQSFKLGFVMGLLTPWEKRVEKEPVAYLYNGVRLPKLPEWDKETYPYAWIRGIESRDGTVKYYLRVSSEAIIYKKTTDLTSPISYRYVYWQYGTGNLYDGITTDDTKWTMFRENTELDNFFNVTGFVFSWVNHDVINDEDGTVYQYATDPVPVYE